MTRSPIPPLLLLLALGAQNPAAPEAFLLDANPEETMSLGSQGTREVFTSPGLPAPLACRITVPAKTAKPWDLQLAGPLTEPLAQGELVGVAFFARSTHGEGEFTVRVQKSAAPSHGPIHRSEKAGKDWRCYGFVGKAGEALPLAQLAIHLGGRAQCLEFSGITVVRFPAGTTLSEAAGANFEDLVRRHRGVASAKPGRYALQDKKLEATLRGKNKLFGKGTLFADTSELGEARFRDGKGEVKPIVVGDQPFSNAYRVSLTQKGKNPWDPQILFFSTLPARRGQVLWFSVWVRSAKAGMKTTLQPTVQLAEPPWECPHFTGAPELEVDGAWREYFFAMPVTRRDFPAGKLQLGFQFGNREQVIDIGGLAAYLFPEGTAPSDLPRTVIPLKYEGSEKNAQWRFDALERIEQNRKADFEIRLLTLDQKPVPGATVTVRQLTQEFGWGTAVTAHWINAPSPEGERYRETLKKYFNKAVLENDLHWENWENAGGRAAASNAIAWLRGNGFLVRGPRLVWPSWSKTPKGLRDLENDKPALAARLASRIDETVLAFRGQLTDWDVVNEPYAHFDLLKIFGTNAMADWFKRARKADPSALLWLNDYDQIEKDGRETGHQDYLEKLVVMLRREGAPIDGMGFQAHFKAPLTPLYKVKEILDRYARLGLKLQVTEFDLATEDEAGQAAYTRDLMTLVFSHPAATGFVTGGFWEGACGIPEGAHFRKDGSMKPNGKVWEDLVTRKWRTVESGKTDPNGLWATRGFLGDYEVTVTLGEKTLVQRMKLGLGGMQWVMPFK